ncbi:DDE superfamily endonuclease [uncultured archaeon]|nr:DDE superfamily endonuclease [uncultured archaeon]
MEKVLDVYKRPYDSQNPVVCMDESPKQLIAETRISIPVSPGQPEKHDYEYKRCGMCNVFIACEPLAGKRMIKVTERKTKQDWAYFMEKIAYQYEMAKKITIVMDNLNTHQPGSFFETQPSQNYRV